VTSRHIRIGHTPDPDDAFMFYALAREKLDTGPIRFQHLLEGIETLNAWALDGRLEVTAISAHAYAYVGDRYRLLPHGASIGRNYGPILVAREALDPGRLRTKRIAVPGRLTTAWLALRLCLGEFSSVEVPFDRVFDAVQSGAADAALVIHEGQLTYGDRGFHKVLDLGCWWHETTGLPLPLGANAVRKDLGDELSAEISRLLRASIEYALAHREEALRYAVQFGRGVATGLADRFIDMYVNDDTRDWAPESRSGLERLLDMAWERGCIPKRILPEFLPN
jgi:1,4-dihydroxy-6-naphthoate synthase